MLTHSKAWELLESMASEVSFSSKSKVPQVNDSVFSPCAGVACRQWAEASSACKQSSSAPWECSQLATVEKSDKHIWLLFISPATYVMCRRTGSLWQGHLRPRVRTKGRPGPCSVCLLPALAPRWVLVTGCYCLHASPKSTWKRKMSLRADANFPHPTLSFWVSPLGRLDQYLDSPGGSRLGIRNPEPGFKQALRLGSDLALAQGGHPGVSIPLRSMWRFNGSEIYCG